MTAQSATGIERIVAAHRGASRLCPENTLSSFRAALARGAAALELDVHLSSDDELVVVHDAHLDRTTDGTGPVRSKSAAEVAGYDAGSWYSADFTGERIPTLDAVLDLTAGGTRLNIELKAGSKARVAERVVETVCRHDAADRSVVMSFDLDSVLAARRYVDARAEARPIVVMPIVSQQIADPLGFVEATGMDGLNYPPGLWDAGLVGRFRDRGRIVHGGLINDAATMRAFFDGGGQMADTDEPDLFGVA